MNIDEIIENYAKKFFVAKPKIENYRDLLAAYTAEVIARREYAIDHDADPDPIPDEEV